MRTELLDTCKHLMEKTNKATKVIVLRDLMLTAVTELSAIEDYQWEIKNGKKDAVENAQWFLQGCGYEYTFSAPISRKRG